MSTANQVLSSDSQLNTDYNFAKVFIFQNDYKKATYTNSTGASVDLAIGTVLGKVTASGKLLPLVAAAVDGSKYPVGVLAKTITVANGASADLTYCVGGHVDQNLLVFNAAETVDTVVDGKTLGDRLLGDTLGIYPVITSENTNFDNA